MLDTSAANDGSACLAVDLVVLIANDRAMQGAADPVGVGAKANAYGLEAADVGLALSRPDCSHFFAAHRQDALKLRSRRSRECVA